jgi:hypothetical protein
MGRVLKSPGRGGVPLWAARSAKGANRPTPQAKKAPFGARPEPLKLEYATRGLNYRQLRRGDTVALYSVTSRQSGRLLGYEVIRPVIQPPFIIKGVTYPLRETYPTAEQFGGGRGWYYASDPRAEGDLGYQKALARYKEVENAPDNKE